MNTSEAGKLLETILSVPGMSENVKMDFKITRKSVLLLSNVIERGLSSKEGDKSSILDNIPEDSLKELKTFSEECLQKAGLTDLHEKLKSMNGK